jgi:hypothetical protein
MRKALVSVALLAVPALTFGGGTSHWRHSSEGEFRKGKMNNVVATNLGDLKLSRAVKGLLDQDPRVTAVYALAEGADGTVYAGTGPHGIVLQLRGEKLSTVATLEDENVFSVVVDKGGQLLVGTGGEKGRILRIDPSKPGEKATEVFSFDGVQYVWRIVQTADGVLYAATGPTGQIHQINPDGTKSVFFDCDENNILSLLSDGQDQLYAGTDPNGLVYRINRKSKDVFVLYDAPEAEVSTLALDRNGTLYAGTGQASEMEEAGAAEMPGMERGGRPEGGESVTPLPSPRPSDPKPPAPPDPNPDEPKPIPKGNSTTQGNASARGMSKFPLAGAWQTGVSAPPMLLGSVGLVQVPAATQKADVTPQQPAPGPGEPPGGDDPTPGPGPGPGRPQPGAGQAMPQQPPAMRGMPPMPVPGGQAAEGNAIYRIDREGFVTEVFRQPVMVLSLVEREGVLLVGTGSDGNIYEVNPASEETIVLAKVDSKQVMSILPAKDGRVMLGLANIGGIAAMSAGFAPGGTYTSPILDAGQISRFGKVRLQGSLPEGSTLTVATRSGNMQEPGDAGWSRWSDEIAATEFVQVPSPTARFLQYRLTMSSNEAKTSPVVEEIDVAYQTPNQPPQVKSLRITAAPDEAGGAGGMGRMMMPPAMMRAMPGGGGPEAEEEKPGGRMRVITWEATDANEDEMEFSLQFRSGNRGPWITLQEKVKEPTFTWDTRGVPDGRYQVRLVASDVKANRRGEGREGSRVSDPVVIDNTPPIIGDLKSERVNGGIRIVAKAVDRGSIVSRIEYAINSKDDWQAVAAVDNIFDSPDEGVSFTIDGLKPGAYQVMLRATDRHDNQAYETVTFVIE